MSGMTADEIMAFLERDFPQAIAFGFSIEHAGDDGVRLRLPARKGFLRPGGTVSGPTLMTLADTAMYLAVLARVGEEALAYTTSLNIHFLRPPPPGDVVAAATLLKLGRRLAVGSVDILSDALEERVAHATVTYSLPPPKGA